MGCPISLYKLGWLFVAAASAGPAFLPAAPTAHPRPWRRDSTSTRTTTISTITTTARTTTTASYVWTCGYLDGDIDEPRTAQAGYNCRIDTADSLWGFCPTSVRSASDCGLAAACQDSGSCSDVCQYNTNTALTTFTCESTGSVINYCSTAILISNSQSYGYLACGATAETLSYYASAITTTNTSTSTASATASASSTETVAVSTSSTAAETATSTAAASSGGHVNTGAIVGGVLGGLALVCMSSVAALYILKRNHAERPDPSSKAPAQSPSPSPPAAPSAPAPDSVGPYYYELGSQNESLKPVCYGDPPSELSGSGAYMAELPSSPQLQHPL